MIMSKGYQKQWPTKLNMGKLEILSNNTKLVKVKECDYRSNHALYKQKGVFTKKSGMRLSQVLFCDGLYALEEEWKQMGCPEMDYVFCIEFPDYNKKGKRPKKSKVIVIPHPDSVWKNCNDGRTKNSGGYEKNNAKFITAYVNGKPLAFIEPTRKIKSGQVLVDYGDDYWKPKERQEMLSD